MVLWFLPNLPIAPPPPALRVGAAPGGRELPQGAAGEAPGGAPAPRRRSQQQQARQQQQRARQGGGGEGNDENNNNNNNNGENAAEEEDEEEEDEDDEDEYDFNIYRALTRRARGGGGRRPLVHMQKWLFLFVMLLSMSPLSSLYHLYNAFFFPTTSSPSTWMFSSGTAGSRSSTPPNLEELLRVLFETAMEKTTNMKNSMTTPTFATTAKTASAESSEIDTTATTKTGAAVPSTRSDSPVEDVHGAAGTTVRQDVEVAATAAVGGAVVAAVKEEEEEDVDNEIRDSEKDVDLPQVLSGLPRNLQELVRELLLATSTTTSNTVTDDGSSSSEEGAGKRRRSERQTVMAASDLLHQVWYDPLLGSRWAGGGMASDGLTTLLDYWNANTAGDHPNADENLEHARHYMTVVLPWMISMTFGLVIPMLMSLGVACCMQQADRRRRRRRPLFWWHLEEEDEEDDEFEAPPPPEEREEVVTERKLLRLLRNLRPFKKKLTASEFVTHPSKMQTCTLAQDEMGPLCDSCNVLDDCSIGSKGPIVFLRLPRGGISWEEASKRNAEQAPTDDDNDTAGTEGAVSPHEPLEVEFSGRSTSSVWRDDVPSPCVICLCPYTKGERVVWSSNAECSHVFHERCLVTWFLRIRRRRDMVCPCCRRTFISSSKAAAAPEKN